MPEAIYRWRGLASPSVEVLRLSTTATGLRAHSELVDAGDPAFALSCDWDLDPHWRTRALRLRVQADQARELLIERTGERTWRTDGIARPDLDGCEEVDLSPTPFCNTLALRRLGPPPGGAGELTALYLPLPVLSPVPSRQRYERVGDRLFRYLDLGANPGFEARLSVDGDGMVRSYEGLFEMIG